MDKKNYKYLGTLEEDIIKQVEIKENNCKRVSLTNEKAYRNQTLHQESHLRNKYIRLKDIGDHS